MKRTLLSALVCLAAFLEGGATAHAEAPAFGPISTIDVQGVSAVLHGTVDPGGLSTTYHFEYVSQAEFTTSGFNDAAATATGSVEPGSGVHPVTGFASGLLPDTFYRYRLVAANDSGTTSSSPTQFETTHGFGFRPGAEGFAIGATAGGVPASAAGSHPDELSLRVGLNQGGDFEAQHAAVDVFGSASPQREYETSLTEADGSTPYPFVRPVGVATDPAGSVWVSDPGGKAVDKFGPAGSFEAQHSGSPFLAGGGSLEGEAFSPAAGELFVADAGKSLRGLRPDASYSGVSIGLGGTACCPVYVAADHSGGETDGDIYVFTGRAVLRVSKSGNPVPFTEGPAEGTNELTGSDATPTGAFGGAGRSPSGGIAVDAAGNFYVADGLKRRVDVFGPSGAPIETFEGAGPAPFGRLTGIAVDPTDGNVLVAEPTAVQELSASGALLGTIVEAGPLPFGDIRGIAVGDTGQLYVADGGRPTEFPDGDIRDLRIEAPPGFIANPGAVPKCTLVEFNTPRDSPYEESHSGENCPKKTQVGTADFQTSLGRGVTRRFGVFNLEPPPGAAAEIGLAPYGAPITFRIELRRDADAAYVLTFDAANIPQDLDIGGLQLSLWGTPYVPAHNSERGNCLNEDDPADSWSGNAWLTAVAKEKGQAPCEGNVVTLRTVPKIPGEKPKPCAVESPTCQPVETYLSYLTLPHKCSGPLQFDATADSWQQPTEVSATAVNRNAKGQVVEMRSCLAVPFDPEATGQLSDSNASSPSGFGFRLTTEEEEFTNPFNPASAPIKTVDALLPEGVSINPSVGAGLVICSPAQFAAETAFSSPGKGCPNGSKVGDFLVFSPLFEEFFTGGVYLGQQVTAPDTGAGLKILVYLVARIRNRGVLITVPGSISADPLRGRVFAHFDELPQLPYTELDMTFRTGQRSLLVSPPDCGPASTTIEMTAWLPEKSVSTESRSQVDKGYGGGPCPKASDPAPPFAPKLVSGGVNANVNSYTPYFVHISRQDTEQELTYYSLVLPKGITGKLAGIPFCPDADVDAARHRAGFAEAAHPSCPGASQVGNTLSGFGAGSTLTYSTGRVYLAGPYHGAPLSLVTINSATVGPFDLGTIVIRSAFRVDPHTAQLRIDSSASDPIPHILEGVPLHLRDIRIYIDRPQFTHNPSSCEPSELESSLGGAGKDLGSAADNTTATATSYFQLLNCRTLGFKPKLGLRLRGGTKRRAFPELRASLDSRGPEDSNLKEMAVTIPHQEFLAQEHIQGICSKAQFNSDSCPADSVYGSAVAYTPLLDDPLRGDVYLRSNPEHAIPDLVASLHSGAVKIILEGRIGPGKKGGIEAYFENLPDQPLTRFVMTLFGGKRGLLQNSADICAVPPVASVKALAQNETGAVFTTKLRGKCGH